MSGSQHLSTEKSALEPEGIIPVPDSDVASPGIEQTGHELEENGSGSDNVQGAVGDTISSVGNAEHEQNDPDVVMMHPTGTFREFPVSPLEVSPSDIPPDAQVITLTDSPLRHSAASPGNASARRGSYHVHCPCCCSLLVSSQCGRHCRHIPRLVFDTPTQCIIKKPAKSGEDSKHPGAEKTSIGDENTEFGKDLSDSNEACVGTTAIAAKCVQQIELWCMNHMREALPVYSFKGQAEELILIKAAFNSGQVKQVQLTVFDVHSIAGALKQYLLGQPDPVIPTLMFRDFMEAARNLKTSEGKDMKTLVMELPVINFNTLKHLLAHLIHLARWQQISRTFYDFDKVIRIFAYILMRPPWKIIAEARIGDIVDIIKQQNDVLYELLQNCDWGEQSKGLLERTVPLHPGASIKDALYIPAQTPEQRLKEVDWYWGKMTNTEARSKLAKQPDGSFLVRNSVNTNEYTLGLKSNGVYYRLRIYHLEGRYGLALPREFVSVTSLILWHRCINLKIYNPNLDTKLIYPIRKSYIAGSPSRNLNKRIDQFKMVNSLLKKKQAQFNYLRQWEEWLAFNIKAHEQTSAFLADMFSVLQDKIVFSYDSAEKDKKEVQSHLELLKSRRDQIKKLQTDQKPVVNRLIARHRMVDEEMKPLSEEICKLNEHFSLLKRKLLKHGKSPEFVSEIENERFSGELNESIHDMSLWLIDCDREQAAARLKGKPVGTFLVRHSSTTKGYVVSVIGEKHVHHLKVPEDEGTFSLVHLTLPMTSILELVLHYHIHNLDDLTISTRLLYPVRAVERDLGTEL